MVVRDRMCKVQLSYMDLRHAHRSGSDPGNESGGGAKIMRSHKYGDLRLGDYAMQKRKKNCFNIVTEIIFML